MSSRYIVIGDGVAGATAAEEIRKLDGEARIDVFTDESEPLYNRIMLKSFMKGELPGLKFTRVHDEEWYDKRDIDLRLETRVANVDAEEGKVETESGESYSYDRLLVATGGSSREFPADQGFENLHYMWTKEDAERIKNAAENSEKAVVIGGGLLGIDLAVAYAENGADTYYIIREKNWWSRGLDPEGAEIIHRKLEEKGVNLITETEIEDFEAENGEVTAAVSKGGETYSCDSVAVAIGQEPNSGIIDVKKNDHGMIRTDEYLETSEPGVYAAGNMVEYQSPVFEKRTVNGSWDHSEAMGRCAGKNMAGEETEFDYVNTYGVGHFDTQFLAIGDWTGEPVSRNYDEKDHYRRLFFDGDRLVGAVLIGYTGGQEKIKKLIKEKKIVENREELLVKNTQ